MILASWISDSSSCHLLFNTSHNFLVVLGDRVVFVVMVVTKERGWGIVEVAIGRHQHYDKQYTLIVEVTRITSRSVYK